MSKVGKAQLRGHGLQAEGNWRFQSDGITPIYGGGGSARCSCGELSPPDISTNAVKRWHREHKDEIRRRGLA